MPAHDSVRPVVWDGDALKLIDQRWLPGEQVYCRCWSGDEVPSAIREMVVRGAPAIGIAAAFGAVLGAREGDFAGALERLARARPTAVNLRWALARMAGAARRDPSPRALLIEAQAMLAEDLEGNRRMGEFGARYIREGSAVLTHCNTGSLATAGYGTALGVIRSAWNAGRLRRVFAGEARPWLQGARLTAWELKQDGIPVTLLADGAAAALMRAGEVSWVIVGADRVTANGDVVNKIGTYSLALAAKAHDVGFMVVAPRSTLDFDLARGGDVPIEFRGDDEVLNVHGRRIAPEGVQAWNPVFDVTPAALVDVLVTDAGAVERPSLERMAALRNGVAA